MPICNVCSDKASNWDTCRITSVTLSAIGVALSIILVTSLYLIYGANYYVYGAAGLGALSLITLAVSLCCCGKVTPKPASEKGSRLKQKAPEEVETTESISEIKEVSEEQKQDEVNLKKVTLTLKHFDPEDFKTWLLDEYKHENKVELFQHTLLTALKNFKPEEPITLSYYQASESKKNFQALLKKKFNNKIDLSTQQEWYHYSHEGHTHVDFANAYCFGGGWLNSGSVQEERMFFEFFSLALLAYVAAKNGKEIHPVIGNDPAPFIIPDMKRDFSIDNVTYGRALYAVDKDKIKDYVSPPPAHTKPVIITGIAARDWRHTPEAQRKYRLKDLHYHLKAFYLTCMGEKLLNPADPIVVSGAWGCGAFINAEKTIIALELLGAKMAGVKLLLTGTNNPHNPNYSEECVAELKKWIDSEESPQAILKQLLKNQKKKPKDWAPKK